jgi:polysaccharide deacetylase family protein (PEP-CTERM system associated)
MQKPLQRSKHILTILVEDYFHVGAFEKLIHTQNWGNFEPRFRQNTIKALDLLDRHNAKATFFVLGWVAEKDPALVREIAERGHEVADRGFYHRSVRSLTPDEFREDLRRSRAALETASGRRVIGYRAAEKLSPERDHWIYAVLAEEGYLYDASMMPTRNTPAERRVLHKVAAEVGEIRELPYSTIDAGIGPLPISGGNYIRQIPYTLTRRAVRRWLEHGSDPFVFYFHVWELDPDQPRISAASRLNRIRHYRKLDKMEWILNENLGLYGSSGVAEYLGLSPEYEAIADRRPASISIPEKMAKKRGRKIPVTVVIPCYNEEASLPYLANTLRSVETTLNAAGYGVSFIFVDDRSTDATPQILNDLFSDKPNFTVIHHAENKGVSAAIMTGLRAAETEIVCSMDCDCTYDPHELGRMIPLLDDADLVTASPYHREGGVRNVPQWRLFLSKGASFLYRRVLTSQLDTYTSCFRVYRKSSVEKLQPQENGFLGVAELLGLLDIAGGRIVEFPAVLNVRLFGSSKMKTLRTIGGHLGLLSRLASQKWFGKSHIIKTSSTPKADRAVSGNLAKG